VGYDLHVSRAMSWVHSQRYPILEREWISLVQQRPDLRFEQELEVGPVLDGAVPYAVLSTGEAADEWSLQWWNGRINVKNPPDAVVRRMIEVADALDAWVVGDDFEIYRLNVEGTVEARQPDLNDIERNPLLIARGAGDPWLRSAVPIGHQEWMDLVRGQPDFRVDEQIEAKLPSGRRLIPCPPLGCWTNHPSGQPVPFFFEENHIKVPQPDRPTVNRMRELAELLGTTVRDWKGDPIPVPTEP
jgi:hypothetical protein